MVLSHVSRRAGKANDQHARSSVYSSVAKERGFHRLDRQEGRGERAHGPQVPENGGPVAKDAGEEAPSVGDRRVGSPDRAVARRGPGSWRKQRHTATRIWERLRDEHGAEVSLSTVTRTVARLHDEHGAEERSSGFMDLVWHPGEAQADFGEVDVQWRGALARMHHFVLDFPHSNVAPSQLMPGENAECTCQALENLFEWLGGVPERIVFDNAAGVGRKQRFEKVRPARLFQAFQAHYGFSFAFCNPHSGHEKGAVEANVGRVRRKLFVPRPSVWNLEGFNEKLPDRCLGLGDKAHWRKGEREADLFERDRGALLPLPAKPFDVVRWERMKADKYGCVTLEGCHRYSADPGSAGREVIIGIRALEIEILDSSGRRLASHPRAYGDMPTDSSDPSRQLELLCNRPNAWPNSRVREALPDPLRGWLDLQEETVRREGLQTLKKTDRDNGWANAVGAMLQVLEATGGVDRASVQLAAARIADGGAGVSYDEPVDLSEYDRAFADTGKES